MKTFAIPDYLLSPAGCERMESLCNGNHPNAVKRRYNDTRKDQSRWFITMGHAGFNSRLNNGIGYKTELAARAAMRRYLKKGETDGR